MKIILKNECEFCGENINESSYFIEINEEIIEVCHMCYHKYKNIGR